MGKLFLIYGCSTMSGHWEKLQCLHIASPKCNSCCVNKLSVLRDEGGFRTGGFGLKGARRAPRVPLQGNVLNKRRDDAGTHGVCQWRGSPDETLSSPPPPPHENTAEELDSHMPFSSALPCSLHPLTSVSNYSPLSLAQCLSSESLWKGGVGWLLPLQQSRQHEIYQKAGAKKEWKKRQVQAGLLIMEWCRRRGGGKWWLPLVVPSVTLSLCSLNRTDLPPAHKPAPPPPKKKNSDMKGHLTSDDIQVRSSVMLWCQKGQLQSESELSCLILFLPFKTSWRSFIG